MQSGYFLVSYKNWKITMSNHIFCSTLSKNWQVSIHCILLHAIKNDPSIAFSILNSMSSTQGSILKEKIFKLKFPSLSFLLLSEKYLKEIASIIFYLCQKSVFKIGVIIRFGGKFFRGGAKKRRLEISKWGLNFSSRFQQSAAVHSRLFFKFFLPAFVLRKKYP